MVKNDGQLMYFIIHSIISNKNVIWLQEIIIKTLNSQAEIGKQNSISVVE